MGSYNLVLGVLVISFLNISVLSIQDFGPQPRIISSAGHLIFNSAENKDIHFVTKGKGKIMLNDGDLTDAASLARNASETLSRVNSEHYDIFLQLQRFKRLVDGHQGILNRLTLLETGLGPRSNMSIPGTSTDRYNDYNLSVINRKLRMLQRKVNRLMLLLTKNECASNPCKNGGICQDLFNAFICQCPNEWEGATCDRDVNECSRYAGTDLGCQNGATCVNKPGSYECLCGHGWFGLHCTRQTASCTSGSVAEICGHGTCIPQNNGVGYKCLCDQGWTTDGTNVACTRDVDECLSSKPPCSTNPPVNCVNVPGTFYCGSCPQGYTGNGYYCSDLDECAVFNGGCSVNPMVRCINTPGSKMCGMCPPGYVGDGTSCSFQGVCGVNNGGCHHFAQCRDNPRISSTFVECICPAGYVGSGIGSNGCVRISEGVDPCASNPCLHGTCVTSNVTGTYVCQCTRRYTGRNCDIRKDPCQPNPCVNGGTCRSIADISYRCICTTAYTGDTCEKERQACGGQLRGNTGTLKYPATHSTVYSHQISCAWIIQTNATKVLNITFTEFHLEGSHNCRFDWLQIHDGRNSAAHSLGRFCGSSLPNGGTITSTHNVIYLWFRSDPSVSSSGFELNWNSVDPVCGGSFEITSHGSIHSPGFPGNYPPNRDCYWSLQASTGKRIQFHFFSLMIGNNPNCSYDYLSIHQGYATSDRLLAKYCNTSHPEPLYSAGPEVLIHFHSDASATHPGFQIAYSVVAGIPGCGGVFTSNEGEISSPSVDGRYPPDLICEYKIQVLEKSRVKLTFLSFALEEDDNCYYDFVEVHEGNAADAPLIGKYCGYHLPPPYLSVGNQVFIIFNSDWGNNEPGFRLKYETVCGGTFSQPSGVIESPGYPNPYMEDQICIYEIIQPLGTSITLNFVDFDMESTSYPDCIFDSVEIRDGDNENSTLIGQYCAEAPPTVQSTYNYLWIKFESDSSVSAKGFQANYTTFNVGCGGILKTNAGVVKSPEHPDSYPSGTTCTWIIVAPPGNVIQLSWLLFQLEQSSTCSFDYVEVYNNHTTNELMGRYCGNALPPTIISSSNMLTIKFITDSSINFDGFMASYTFVDEASACGGRYFTSSGVIKSPFYPNDYPTSRECTWVITVNSGQQIMLNVTDFVLESFSNCNYDYLEIRNGGTASSPLIGKYCGTKIPKQIPSYTSQIYLFFRSDMSHTDRGFKITWDSTATGCGGSLTSPKGSIISPFYPEPYSQNTECYWRISVSAGSVIQLVVADIDLEDHVNCGMDYVEVFDGSDTSAKSLGKFCFTVNVPYIRSTSNHVTVKFRSDGSFQLRGFHIQYSTVCHNTLKGYRGVIESPNFPHGYPQDQDCNWKIDVAKGNKINITFSHFELERSTISTTKNCSFDFVEIKYSSESTEYEENSMLKYGSYCGSDVPSLITINSNIAEIHFVSDNLLIGSGFRLEWQIEGCGGILTHPTGSFSTPKYPNGYPGGTICEWIIRLDYGTSIQVTFIDIDFEPSPNCNYDYILITNGPDASYPKLSNICTKSSKPTVVTSTGNTMFVKFESDNSFHGKGFLANYTSVSTKCGGLLTAPLGSLHSPNYPKNYDKNDTCEWLLDIEENHLIELTFEDVDLAGDCNTDYIKVYDGPTTKHPVLTKLCENSKPNNTFRSTSNQMVVELRTGENYAAKGFLANYTIGCGARLITESSGIISLSDTTLASTSLLNCSWTIISSDPSQHISLTITRMDSMECFDGNYGIKIYGGENSNSPVVGSYCESKVPPTLTSDGNAFHIELTYPIMNFVAKYSVLDTTCGGTLTGASGYFATPRYPSTYPMDVQCEWIIQVSAGNRIMLSFNAFEIVTSENCNLDYLEIRAENGRGKLLGTFCDALPTNITQVGNLWILFKSGRVAGDDSGATAKGFLAEYSLIHGIDLTGPSGQIASPLYPNYFFKTGEFTWRITVGFGKAISVTFIDFYIEADSADDCYLSSIELFDGYDDNAPSLQKICGLNKPDPIQSTSNVMYIKMSYDSVRHGSKFLLDWLEIDNILKYPVLPTPKVTGCGSKEIIDMSELTLYNLTSPGYPNGYTENLRCEWIFSTLPGYHLVIDFFKVDVENIIGQCLLDVIKVYNGKGGAQDWDLLATVCFSNATLDDYIHAGNLMKVEFHTDNYMNGTGFRARIQKMCGGSMTGSNGVISINSSIFNYHQDEACEWNITVNPGRTIEVKFLKLDIASNRIDSCDTYILLKNGHYPDSPILGVGKYCGNAIPEPLHTTGNYLSIKYNGHPGKSFQLSYQEISQGCGGSIMLSKIENQTQISSPNYPNIPPPYTECFWTFIAPPGESLRIDFEERFDITESEDCQLAAVEIRDGGSKYSYLLGTYCAEIPNSTFSSDNMLHVRFFTNVEDPRNGFKAQISLATCGGIIRSESGEIHSPNFNIKKLYPRNSNCIWHIIGPHDHYLTLHFNTIDLEISSDCLSVDHVTLEERFKFNDTIRSIGDYCGTVNPGEITSSSNEVLVNLITGSSDNMLAGFSLRFNASREVCGGNLNAESGIIESPGYPVSYHNNRECEWLITVPEGRRITMEIIDFDVDIHGYDQGIGFFNDKNFKSDIKYMRELNSSETVQSSSNTMLVMFWGVHASYFRGFRARYSSDEPTICRGNFNQNSGIIRHINESLYYCTWKHISNPASQTVSMNIILNFPEATSEPLMCTYARASVIITRDNEKDIIAEFCRSRQHPAIVRSPYPITKLIGYQDRRYATLQYTINYATHPCGGVINGQDGYITSPGFPNKYSQTIECAWLLKLPSDERIKLNFMNFNLDANCEFNYLVIYNGDLPTSPRIGHFCENNKPTTMNSQGNTLLIEYHADERSSGTGFKLGYEPVMGGCGGIFHDHTRLIETPSYPSDYPNNAECLWEIVAQNGYHINLEFIDRFYIEQSQNCANDFMEVWDYKNDTWQSLGKKCGRDTPTKFNSTSNKMKILFRSNDKVKATGFKARWTLHCGGVFEADEITRYIVSPGYPNEYNNSLECVYTIRSFKSYVNIAFEDFSLEQDLSCMYDNVSIQIISAMANYPTNIGTPKVYCGSRKPPTMRQRDGVIITFATDSWVTRRGFKLSYKTDSCGGVITEPTAISSPSSGDSSNVYANAISCTWNITAPPDKNVVVRFTAFEFEHNLYCSYDSLSIFEGITVNETSRLALLCGNISHDYPVVKSTGNSMTVLMKTDYTNHFAGFKAIVYFTYGPRAGCGGVITVDDTKNYEAPAGLSNLDCHWEIITTRDHVLKIRFTELHLMPCTSSRTVGFGLKNCTCNLIEIRDGGSSFSELIDQLCDNTLPQEYTTSGHTAWIRLYTVETTRDKPFKVSFTRTPSICGPSILNVTNQTQVLKSPLFPNSYPNNIKCTWLLRSSEFLDKFDLRFTEFDLAEATNADFFSKKCGSDRVEISDKVHSKVITQGLGTATIFSGSQPGPIYGGHRMPVGVQQFCGRHALSFDHYSGQNEVIVSFYSGMNNHGNGFKMEYQTAGCNRNFSSVQGRLLNSQIKGDCIITITAPANYTISLHFLTFILYDAGDCEASGFEVHDGGSKTDKQLAKLCGYNVPNSIFSNGNQLYIHIWNNNANSVAFYDAVFTSSAEGKGCGGIFYNYAGKFTSPLYPLSYRESSTCTWEILVPQDMQVAFKFTAFDINGGCSTDYAVVKTYNRDESITTEHHFCKEDNPAVLQSENNHITVVYTTTVNNGGAGWIAQFVAITSDSKLDWQY